MATSVSTQGLIDHLQNKGYRGRVVSIHRLQDLQEGIEGLRHDGLLDEDLYKDYLNGFDSAPPQELPNAKSILVVAAPQPQYRVTFQSGTKSVRLIIPPTYLFAQEADLAVQHTLYEWLAPHGYRALPARLPKKLLAMRSGLGAYGKNNICYVEDIGSFHRLSVFYSDFPCREDTWREPHMLEACQNCTACQKRCPTGAIDSDRFLIHAERCLTFWNEKPSDVPFPDWIDPQWHEGLVGCMRCQKACPENKAFWNWIEEGPQFSHDETVLLLAGASGDQLPTAIKEKLEGFDLMQLLYTMPRNLEVYI